MSSRAVDPSISKTPLPTDATDLATVCVLCSHNCGLRVDVAGGRIADVRADASNPITHGYICNKGFSIRHYVEHAQRVQHPLKRQPDGGFARISWEQAITEIAARLGAIREAHSPRAIGLVGIGGQANHMDAPYGLTFLTALGSKRWFNAFAQEKTQHFLIDQWMFDAPPSTFFHPDIEQTRFLLMLGTNPKISNRGHNATETFKALAANPRQTVVVLDPRDTETTRTADRHLRITPGSDAYVLLGMAAAIVASEGLVDARVVAEQTVGFEPLRQALAQVDIDEMARRAGIAPAELLRLAREYAEAESAAIMFDLAVEHNLFSTLTSYLIHVLAVITGNAGRRGGNVFYEALSPPDHSPKRHAEPERALASGIPAISALGGYGMFSPSLVPEEVLLDHPQRLRALIVEGANPLLSFSDTARWREARERLDLLVVIEPAMTETAQLADYVLPTPVGYEKWEIAGFPKGYPQIYAQLRPPVVPGPPEALPEPEIYVRLAEAMRLVPPPPPELTALAAGALEPEGAAAYLGAAMQAAGGSQAHLLFWGYRTLGPHLPSPALTAVWAQVHANAFVRLESLLRTLGEEWRPRGPFAVAHEIFRRILVHPEGVEIGRVDPERGLADIIGFDDKKIRLAPPPMLDEIGRAARTDRPRDPRFPLVLAAGLRTQWTANTIQRDPAWRKGRGPHCALNLSPADAAALGIAGGDRVRLVTKRGALELPAAIDKRLQPGHVWVPNGFGARYPKDGTGELETIGVNLNEITASDERDPFTGCPMHKYTLCRVERCE
ncbi:molybdopterin-dependent oxidoreductase [bacterium]|nr:molybdopterin-dependent oxidoreductase [bacterium]